MPKVRWVVLYEFCKFHMLSSSAKILKGLRFDKVTDSLKVGTFLRHSVGTFMLSLPVRVFAAKT